MSKFIYIHLPDLSTFVSKCDQLASILEQLNNKKDQLPMKFKFIYADCDGDEISVTNPEDFEIYKEYLYFSQTIVPLKVQQVENDDEGFALASNMLDSVDQFACSLHTQMEKLEQFKQNKVPANKEEETILQKIEQQMELYKRSIQEQLSNTVKDMVEQRVQEMTIQLKKEQKEQKPDSPRKPQPKQDKPKPEAEQQLQEDLLKSFSKQFKDLGEVIVKAKSQAEIDHTTNAYWELFAQMKVKFESNLKQLISQNQTIQKEEQKKKQEEAKLKAQQKEAEKLKNQAEKAKLQEQKQKQMVEKAAKQEADKLAKEQAKADKEAKQLAKEEKEAKQQELKRQKELKKLEQEEIARIQKEQNELNNTQLNKKLEEQEQVERALEEELAKQKVENEAAQNQQQQQQQPAKEVKVVTPEEAKLNQLLEIFPKADQKFLLEIIRKNKKATLDELIEKLLYN